MIYNRFAQWFEFLNDDCDYIKWSQYFTARLEEFGAGKNGLELGCGSGAFCRLLTRAGYRMTGLDLSRAMLQVALEKAQNEGLNILYIEGDAATFRAPEKYDFILAPNDCYNYIPKEKLPAAFRHAAAALKKGGIFWVDVSSEYKYRNIIANNMFADDRDEVTYLSFNRLEEDRVITDLTLFIREEDGRFSRADERHVQYIHTEEELISALEGAGFCSLRAEGHLGQRKEGSQRLNLLCKKK